MKNSLVLLLVLTLVLITVAGCGEAPAEVEPGEITEEEPEGDVPAEDGLPRLGLGIVTTIGRSLDYDPENEIMALGQVDSVIAAATFDADGRVIDVMIDTAQVRVSFDEELQVATDHAAEFRSKKELGDDYGMRVASPIDKEWDEQITALETWMAGKTIEEIKALDLMDDGSPDDPDLVSSVTITVSSYIAALEKAYQNAVPVKHDAEMLGLGHNISIGRSMGLDEANEIMPLAQVDVIIAAAAFDASGVVGAVLIDTAQTRINFDEEGQVTSDKTATYPTKRELGDDYGMRVASSIDMEWDEQIAALEDWMTGKTVSEIAALDLEEGGAPADPDLVTSATITVTGYLAALEEAFSRAR